VSCGRVSPVKLESSAGVTWPHASQCRGGVRLACTTTLALGCQGKVCQKTTVGAGWRGAAWGGQSAQTPRRPGRGPLTGPGERVGPDGWPAQIWTGASRGLGGPHAPSRSGLLKPYGARCTRQGRSGPLKRVGRVGLGVGRTHQDPIKGGQKVSPAVAQVGERRDG
jgi:hypothetical protein